VTKIYSRQKISLDYILLDSWHPYFWIVLGCFILYFKTLAFRFTYFDDNTLIIDNLWYLKNIWHIFDVFRQTVFLGGADFFYRPILVVSFIFNAYIGGPSPFIYHLTNIILHAIAAGLAFKFFQQLGYGRRFAFVLSGIFLVHPALVQAVAWIPGRNDSLLAIFLLASLISFVNYTKCRKTHSIILLQIYFNLALYTKETAFLIAPLCLLLYTTFLDTKSLTLKEWLAITVGWIFSAVLWFVMRSSAGVTSAANALSANDLLSSLKDVPLSLMQYAGKVVLPFNLSGFPITQDTASIYGIITALIIIIAHIVTNPERRKKSLFGLFWFIMFIIPTFILPDKARFEHRLYVPIIGIFVLLSEFVLSHKSFFRPKIFLGGSSIILILFAIISFNHSDIFLSRLPFWKSAVATSPHSSSAHNSLGVRYWECDLMALAEEEFSKAIQLSPGNVNALINLANIYRTKQNYEKAGQLLAIALQLKPTEHLAWYNLGIVHYLRGNDTIAINCWEKTLAINPNYYYAYKTLAAYYFLHGDAKALTYIQKCRFSFNRAVTIPANASLQDRNWLIKFSLEEM